jgi:hypothetical protein
MASLAVKRDMELPDGLHPLGGCVEKNKKTFKNMRKLCPEMRGPANKSSRRKNSVKNLL